MAGLQRSTETFRRSGSSGLVWEERFSGSLNSEEKTKTKEEGELRRSRSTGSGPRMDRSQSNGGRGYRTGCVSPTVDPPSPKVSVCGFCGVFGGKFGSSNKKKSKRTKRANKN